MDFNFENVVRSVVRTAHLHNDEHMSGSPVWFAVAERCGVGATSAVELCHHFGVNPNEIIARTRYEKVRERCEREMDDDRLLSEDRCIKMWAHIEMLAPSK